MLKKHSTATVIEVESEDGRERVLSKQAARAQFEYTPRPGYIYVRSRMISSRCNDNFDEFPAEEIKKAYKTFIGKPVFVNHHNSDHRRARGVIVDAVLHEHVNPDGSPDVWVEGLMEIDALTYPKLAQSILNKEITKTSMGTDVAFSVCSACGNKATSPAEYCAHIPAMKGKKFFRHTASGEKVGEIIREICYGLKFFENSLLVEEPADPTALFLGVDDRGLKMTSGKDESEVVTVEREVRDKDRFEGVSLKEDDSGYYVHTHRARSRSYPTPDSIPNEEIALIRSTGAKTAAPIADARDSMPDSPERQQQERPKTRKDQQKAPPEVDTLRDEDCPVCGNREFFSGDRCQVCGFTMPPAEFLDPDTTLHKRLDLRSEEGAPQDGQVSDVNERGEIEDPNLVDPEEIEEEFVDDPTSLLCPNCGFQAPSAEPTTQTDPSAEPDGFTSGDLCPNCEEDYLLSMSELEELMEEEAELSEEFPEEDPDDVPQEFDDRAVDDERQDTKRQRKSSRKVNPIMDIDEMMRRVAVLEAQLEHIAALAGIQEEHDAIRVEAERLFTEADINNPASPVPDPPSEEAYQSTEEALEPDTYDDPQNLGISPGSTEGVPADQVDTPLRPGVTMPTAPVNDLHDVTAPVVGTETQVPLEQTRIETEVRVGDPDNPQRAFPWTITSSRGEQEDDSALRAIASIRLAELQIEAGLEEGDKYEVAGQIQASARSTEQISHEIDTLTRVAKTSKKRTLDSVPKISSDARHSPSLSGLQSTASSADDDPMDLFL